MPIFNVQKLKVLYYKKKKCTIFETRHYQFDRGRAWIFMFQPYLPKSSFTKMQEFSNVLVIWIKFYKYIARKFISCTYTRVSNIIIKSPKYAGRNGVAPGAARRRLPLPHQYFEIVTKNAIKPNFSKNHPILPHQYF